MSRPRFTIAGVIAIVAFMAVGLAALRGADDAWDGGLFGLTALTLLMAVLLAIHRRGARRAYWLGFTMFGWVYLVMSLVPPIEGRLPTSKGLAYLDSKVPGRARTSRSPSRSTISRSRPVARSPSPRTAGGWRTDRRRASSGSGISRPARSSPGLMARRRTS